ncbi:predicted protein [Botrytis cinerea T4]|uniref:Uncharacterized protein n=1 Tax=Botryotinia fuckeliana (strain T4) TaxID=999810 RepID=G2XRP2_BOTF4|nr:predicted protein [Botrytis cinerea T4]
MANFAEGFRFLAHSRISHKLCDCRTGSSTERHLRGIISHNCLLPHSPDLEFSATFYAASLSYKRQINVQVGSICHGTTSGSIQKLYR